ncbi:MAG TPA: hypothetical protein VI172_08330 [Candidatus Dormibacteraeota bacterium]|jgi:hypothetical protein
MTKAFWGPACTAAADILAEEADRGSADLMAEELVDRLFTVARGGMGAGTPRWKLFEEQSDKIQVAINQLPPAGKARAWLQGGTEHDRDRRHELMERAAKAAAKKAKDY